MSKFIDQNRGPRRAADGIGSSTGATRVNPNEKTAADWRKSAARNEEQVREAEELADKLELAAAATKLAGKRAVKAPNPYLKGLGIVLTIIASRLMGLYLGAKLKAEIHKQKAARDLEKARELELRDTKRVLENIREGRVRSMSGTYGDALAPEPRRGSEKNYAYA